MSAVSSDAPWHTSQSIDVGSGDQSFATNPPDGFFVVGTGNIVFQLADGNNRTLTALAANTFWKFGVAQINQTGTTLTGFVVWSRRSKN